MPGSSYFAVAGFRPAPRAMSAVAWCSRLYSLSRKSRSSSAVASLVLATPISRSRAASVEASASHLRLNSFRCASTWLRRAWRRSNSAWKALSSSAAVSSRASTAASVLEAALSSRAVIRRGPAPGWSSPGLKTARLQEFDRSATLAESVLSSAAVVWRCSHAPKTRPAEKRPRARTKFLVPTGILFGQTIGNGGTGFDRPVLVDFHVQTVVSSHRRHGSLRHQRFGAFSILRGIDALVHPVQPLIDGVFLLQLGHLAAQEGEIVELAHQFAPLLLQAVEFLQQKGAVSFGRCQFALGVVDLFFEPGDVIGEAVHLLGQIVAHGLQLSDSRALFLHLDFGRFDLVLRLGQAAIGGEQIARERGHFLVALLEFAFLKRVELFRVGQLGRGFLPIIRDTHKLGLSFQQAGIHDRDLLGLQHETDGQTHRDDAKNDDSVLHADMTPCRRRLFKNISRGKWKQRRDTGRVLNPGPRFHLPPCLMFSTIRRRWGRGPAGSRPGCDRQSTAVLSRNTAQSMRSSAAK